MKKYRDGNGRLTTSIAQIKKETAEEAKNYYRPGSIYKSNEDDREYVYCIPKEGDGELAHFLSFDGYHLFIPVDCLGTFLPYIADEGIELIFIE